MIVKMIFAVVSTFDIQCVVYVPIRCKEEEEGKRDRETKRLKKELISNANITSMFVQLQVHSSYFHTENRYKRSKMSNPNRTIGENKEEKCLTFHVSYENSSENQGI